MEKTKKTEQINCTFFITNRHHFGMTVLSVEFDYI